MTKGKKKKKENDVQEAKNVSQGLTLKIKQPVTLPAKWVYSGIAKELQFGTCKLW